jgi:hypothetical protein
LVGRWITALSGWRVGDQTIVTGPISRVTATAQSSSLRFYRVM